MATTTKGYPYPVGTTNNNTPADIQSLAEAVDAAPGVAPLSTAARNALTGGALWVGRQIYNTTTKQFEWYDGAAWQPFGFMRGEVRWLSYKPATSPPTGWLLADGSTVSQSTYADLFALLGTVHNTGGETAGTFRLPNLTRRVAVGYDATALTTYDVGKVGGVESVALTEAQLPVHHHVIDHNHPNVTSTVQSANHTHGTTGVTAVNDTGILLSGGAHAHNHESSALGTFYGPAGANDAVVRAWDGGTPIGLDAGFTSTAGTHGHTVSDPTHNHNINLTSSVQSASHTHDVDVPNFTGNSGDTGSGSAHENRMPFITLYGMVKY